MNRILHPAVTVLIEPRSIVRPQLAIELALIRVSCFVIRHSVSHVAVHTVAPEEAPGCERHPSVAAAPIRLSSVGFRGGP